MKNLDLLKKISVLSPLAPGALLAGCVLIALSGYTPVSVMASGDAASGNAFLSGDASGDASGNASGNASHSAISIAKASTKGKSKSSSAAGGSGSLASVSGMNVSDVEDGTYTGSGSGWGGDITVQVTVSGGKITAIDVLSQSETPEYWAKASSLISSIIGAQSTSVDDVSGATYSSRGIKSAVENALSKAKKGSSSSSSESQESDSKKNSQKESFPYEDGLYEGEGEGYNDKIRLALAIQDKQIKAIIILSQDEDEQFFAKAKQILSTIVTDQTTDVDTVSGATYSSKGLIAAVNNALENAKNGKKMSDQKDTNNSGNGNNSNGGNTNNGSNGNNNNGGNNSGNNGGSSDGGNSGGNKTDGDNSDQTKYSFKSGSYSYDVTVVNDPAITAPNYEDDSWSSYNTTITVTIADDTVTGISFTEGGDGWIKSDRRYMNNAINGILPNIPSLSGLTANGNGSYVDGIDTVSGATCSSITVRAAVDMALQEAAVNAN